MWTFQYLYFIAFILRKGRFKSTDLLYEMLLHIDIACTCILILVNRVYECSYHNIPEEDKV